MALGHIMTRKIITFTCLSDPNEPALAIIEGWHMHWRGATPMAAHAKAAAWRKEITENDNRLSKRQKAELLGEAVDA